MRGTSVGFCPAVALTVSVRRSTTIRYPTPVTFVTNVPTSSLSSIEVTGRWAEGSVE